MMPVMDGLAFCQQLKTDKAISHIPVILLTARSLDEQRAEGYEHGADAYLSKPFSLRLLFRVLIILFKVGRNLVSYSQIVMKMMLLKSCPMKQIRLLQHNCAR